jgi:hypothetical protein
MMNLANMIKFAKKDRMSKFSEYMQNRSASKGGMIGGLLGAFLSGKSYSSDDSTIKKAGKTGIFAALGYLIGDFLEKLISKFRSNNTF